MRRFKDDQRVVFWELFNEPGRGHGEDGEMTSAAGSKSNIGGKSNKIDGTPFDQKYIESFKKLTGSK